jgi:dTDP-4-amino-4,6-dideoxygalactose transaminase
VITGEGGLILAREEKAADRLKTLALHGMSRDAWKRFGDEGFKHYQVVEFGFKYNLMDLQAALGIGQLQRVEQNWGVRQQIWNRYQEAFADLPVTRPADPEPETRHALHLYTLLIDRERAGVTRDEFLNLMTKRRIGTGVHYLSVADHPVYQRTFGWSPDDVPHATRVGRQTVSLPLSPKLGGDDVTRIIYAVREIVG